MEDCASQEMPSSDFQLQMNLFHSPGKHFARNYAISIPKKYQDRWGPTLLALHENPSANSLSQTLAKKAAGFLRNLDNAIATDFAQDVNEPDCSATCLVFHRASELIMKSAIALEGPEPPNTHNLLTLHKLLDQTKCPLPSLKSNDQLDEFNSLQIISLCALSNVYETQVDISCKMLKKNVLLMDPYLDSIVKYMANFTKE